MVPSDRKRNNGYKLKHREFHFNLRKKFFVLRVAEHWNRLARRSWGFPLETFNPHLDTFLFTCSR